MQANRMTHLILHEMLEGRPMLSPTLRGPHKGPPLEQLELELKKYIRQLTSIHKLIFYHGERQSSRAGGKTTKGGGAR